MPKLKKIATAGFLSLLLTACQGLPLTDLNQLLQPQSDHYALPLKLSMEQDCDGSSQLIYEIQSDGSFRFLHSASAAKPTFVTRKLLHADVLALDALLEKVDLALNLKKLPAAATSSEPTPASTPACRSTETLTVNFDGRATRFDRTSSDYGYDETYNAAFQQVRDLLDSLAKHYADGQPSQPLTPSPSNTPSPGQRHVYTLPLSVNEDAECDGPTRLRYEINADGRFRYLSDESPELSPETSSAATYQERQLSLSERNDLNLFLSKLNLAQLQKSDSPIPADAFQTDECRVIQSTEMGVDGQTHSFDYNGRKWDHSEAYRLAFAQLLDYLQALRNGNKPVVPVTDYRYALPLKLESQQECGGSAVLRYEIRPEGTLVYAQNLPDDLEPDAANNLSYGKRQLSEAEMASLQTLLAEVDLARRDEASSPIPPDAPQTEECREIQTLTLEVNGNPRSFDLNGRKIAHSEAYRTAWNKLSSQLEALALKVVEPPPVTGYRYALPLKIEAQQECGGDTYLRYELSPEGRFRYLIAEPAYTDDTASSPGYDSRQLTAAEMSELTALLSKINLAKAVQDSTPIPADAPQTMECRTIETLTIQVNDSPRRFDYNGRNYSHSEAYLTGFRELQDMLARFQSVKPPVTDGVYSLPLKISLRGECGLPEYSRYKVAEDGLFTWALEDVPTFAPGNPPMASRYLTEAERANLLAFLNRTELIARFQRSEPIPADAPQTKECRSIVVYDLTADGATQTFEGEGSRLWQHSDYLLADLKTLQQILQDMTHLES